MNDNWEYLRPVAGSLIINADDWGRDRYTTDQSLDCLRCGGVSAVSAMVFMEDSERAAITARDFGVDSGLHLNLTTPFSGRGCSLRLRECQEKIARYLLRHRFAQVMFHPGLTSEFEYVVKAQIDEFGRLYGMVPTRLDGHHHMHLCANVILQHLLPLGSIVRRNFSFEAGEKSVWNRAYRGCVDRMLKRRHRLADYFFSFPPLQPDIRLRQIAMLARNWVVEIEAHPVKQSEYQFLMEGGIARFSEGIRIATAEAMSR
ncbi:MAG: ChbG/HpnK family deacetylase [Nitrospira sp.]|nr:ChbG/HpnK family deacetylase [Nitrospira sp.]